MQISTIMRFKDYINLSEEQTGSGKSLMGYTLNYYSQKPSDGRPFKNLISIAGGNPRGGNTSGRSFMKKK